MGMGGQSEQMGRMRTLDGQKDLAQRVRHDDIVEELGGEARNVGKEGGRNVADLGHPRKQIHHAERIVQILNGINEGGVPGRGRKRSKEREKRKEKNRIISMKAAANVNASAPLLDEMVKRDGRLVLAERIRDGNLALAERLAELARKDLELAELVEERLVREEGNVLCTVVGARRGAALVYPLLVLGLARVDALQDTKAAKVRKGDLQLAHSARARDVQSHLSLLPLLLLTHGGEMRAAAWWARFYLNRPRELQTANC